MASHVQLKAQRREMLGKKVRRLRREGVLPATVYGNHIEPQSIQVDAHELRNVFRHAGRTQVIDLAVEGGDTIPVFIKQSAINAKRNELLHVEFLALNLRQKTTGTIPLHIIGESQAVRDGGILLTLLDHVDVEALPDDLPEAIETDISSITEVGVTINAGDLPLPQGVTLVTPAEELVLKVDAPAATSVEEEEAQLAAQDAAAAGLPADAEAPPAANAVPESS